MHLFLVFLWLYLCVEMAGHHKRGEVPSEASAPQHYRVQRLLPEGAHSMGKGTCACFSSVCVIQCRELVFDLLSLSLSFSVLAGDGVLLGFCL